MKNGLTLAEQYADEQPAYRRATLIAFDPLTGETKWSVEHPFYWNSGVLATAGDLVFQGDALGFFSAYDADTGEKLWAHNNYVAMLAPPITYAIDGKQYIAILAGAGANDHQFLWFDGRCRHHEVRKFRQSFMSTLLDGKCCAPTACDCRPIYT